MGYPPNPGDWYDDSESGIDHTCEAAVDLSLGDTDVTPPTAFAAPMDALEQAGREAHKYSRVAGRLDTRRRVVESWLQNDRLATPIPVEEAHDDGPCVLITPGGQAAVHHAVNAVLDPDEAALLCEPHYPYHANSVHLFEAGTPTTTVGASADSGFQPDLETIRQTVRTNDIGAVVICSPANPTGARYDRSWLEGLAAIAREEDLWVVSDEVYAFMTYGDRPHRSIATLDGMADRTIVVGSFSKVFGVSGWRLGFLRCPEPLFEPLREVTDCIAMQASTPNQVVLADALSGPDPFAFVDDVMDRFEARLDVLIQPFRESEKTVVHRPSGAFYLLPMVVPAYRDRLDKRGGYEAARRHYGQESIFAGDCLHQHLLSEADVLGVPGRKFGESAAPGVRLAFGQATLPDLEAAVDRIRGALQTF